MNPSAPTGQRRLDEVLSEHPDSQAEREYGELREARPTPPKLRYEERVAAWVEEREKAMAHRAGKKGEPAGPTAPP